MANRETKVTSSFDRDFSHQHCELERVERPILLCVFFRFHFLHLFTILLIQVTTNLAATTAIKAAHTASHAPACLNASSIVQQGACNCRALNRSHVSVTRKPAPKANRRAHWGAESIKMKGEKGQQFSSSQ